MTDYTMQQTINKTLATIKAMQVQHENGYHISDSDYSALTSAVNDVNALYHAIAKKKSGA